MSRYIDADAFVADARMVGLDTAEKVFFALAHQPSIDIVRCGECMHNGSYDTDCPFGWKNGEWNMPKPCDFCSYGERSE